MKRFLITFTGCFLSLSYPHFARSSECQYYINKAEILGCDTNNYLTEFGYNYCRAYEMREHHFTDSGKDTLVRIRRCLVSELENYNSLTCENVEQIGFNSHLRCYVENGFCDLKVYEKLYMYVVASPRIFNKEIRKMRKSLTAYCKGYRKNESQNFTSSANFK